MSDEIKERLKRIEEHNNTVVSMAVGYFVLGPILLLIVIGIGALVRWAFL